MTGTACDMPAGELTSQTALEKGERTPEKAMQPES